MRPHSIIALVLLGVTALGCTRVEISDQVANDVTLTATVSMGGTPASKALTAAGVKTFAPGEQLAVVYTPGNAGARVRALSAPLTAEDISDDGMSAAFTVTLTDPVPSAEVSYIYPAAMAAEDGSVNYGLLSAQDGTLASLAASLDLAVFEGNFTAVATLPGLAFLENPLTIGEFTVSDGSSDITSGIVSFTVSAGADTYTINRAAEAGPIYVAMRPVSGDLSFTAYDGGLFYEKSVTGKTMAAGSMYPIGISMTGSFNALATPLTFEAVEPGAEVSFRLPSNTESGTVQYRVNGGEWTSYSSGTAISLASAGDKLQFRGKNDTYYVNTSTYDYGQFSCTAPCYVYGNIMSLVTDYSTDENAFQGNTTLVGASTFYRLFESNANIQSHTSRPLALPATTLTQYCYDEMFFGCTGLTAAPALPATTLASSCYRSMFEGCTSLTMAPALPATTLASSCYRSMFDGCTSLSAAPALPAETLAEDCYNSMFFGCTSLTMAPALPATTLASSCYSSMFDGCTSLSAAPALPAETLASGCYAHMFYGCTSLTTAPALPAETLASYCYGYMFQNCTSLTAAPVLPAETLASTCYEHMFNGCTSLSSVTCLAVTFEAQSTEDWLTGVSSSGTFTCSPYVNWDYGLSGIPPGWMRVDYVAP